MTTMHAGRIPQLTLGWRLKMALDHGDIKRGPIAEALGVDESTISRWCNGGGKPPARAFILQWAEITGVDAGWLETGQGTPGPGTTEDEPGDDSEQSNELERAARRHRGRSLGAPAATRSYAA